MKKTMIYLPEETHEGLRKLAFERRVSIAELIRVAVDSVYGEDIEDISDMKQEIRDYETEPSGAVDLDTLVDKINARSANQRFLGRHATSIPMPSPTVPPELHLRRLTMDEALYRLEEYLDAAFMAGHSTVRIIHGKGTGTLRDAVGDRLAEHSLVKSYRLALYGEGDAGVTVVELHQR
ncbi:Smr/MutS family protein [Chloroflexota bacterium]